MYSRFRRWLIRALGGVPNDELYFNDRDRTIKICRYPVNEYAVKFVLDPIDFNNKEYEEAVKKNLACQIGEGLLKADKLWFDSRVEYGMKPTLEARVGVVDISYFEDKLRNQKY